MSLELTEAGRAKIATLRQLADFLEARPLIANESFMGDFSLYLYCESREDLAEAVRAMGGGEKSTDSTYFNVVKQINPMSRVTVYASKNNTCERVQVGEKVVEKPIMQQVGIETTVVPVYEWTCPESILAP